MVFERPIVKELTAAIEGPPALIQVLIGARQVGKSTAAEQVEKRLGWPSHTASADTPRSANSGARRSASSTGR